MLDITLHRFAIALIDTRRHRPVKVRDRLAAVLLVLV